VLDLKSLIKRRILPIHCHAALARGNSAYFVIPTAETTPAGGVT